MKILENGVVRDATPKEIAQREADIAAEEKRIALVVPPTKEELLAELQALTAKINALG
jgi:hypothetical protein